MIEGKTEEQFYNDVANQFKLLLNEDKGVDGALKIEYDISKFKSEILSYYDIFVPTKPEYYHSKKTPKKFKNTHLLSESAQRKVATGKYNPYPYKSKKWFDFAKEEVRRCREGYTINEGTEDELSITGYHYFFLNYKQVKVIKVLKNGREDRKMEFPYFWPMHYHFFWAFEEAIDAKKFLCLLKPRATGFSELLSSIGTLNYALYKDEVNLYYAYEKRFIEGDGIFTKVKSNIDFLDTETENMFKHLRSVNRALHLKAGIVTKDGNVKSTGGEVIGAVADHPRKVRGNRAKLVAFEESGSFIDLLECFSAAKALVQYGGYTFGTIVMWGTGGEIGDGIFGLKSIFNSPRSYDMKAFRNLWDLDLKNTECGFFFPVYANMQKFLDKDGNADEYSAFVFEISKRIMMLFNPDGESASGHSSEFPFTPGEALQRNTESIFPVRMLNQHKMKLITSGISNWVHGEMDLDKDGAVEFVPNSKKQPIDDYPINKKKINDMSGCISILETPYKGLDNKVPANLYVLSVDPFSKDESPYSDSVGAVYVFKRHSPETLSKYSGTIVAKYIGRPRLNIFWDQIFMLAEYYNCKVQSEILGGGTLGIEQARLKNKTHLLAESIDIDSNKQKNTKSITYFLNSSTDKTINGLISFAEWLITEHSREEVDGETIYKLNLHTIEDLGLIEECINFVDDPKMNFDRISSMKVMTRQLGQMQNKTVKDIKKRIKYFNSSSWFDGDSSPNKNNIIGHTADGVRIF